jgi:hypothetical protein
MDCRNVRYEENGLTYTEIIKQKHENCCTISAGLVDGGDRPREATIYVKVERDTVSPTVLFLRPDDAQTLIWALSSVLWSYLSHSMDDTREGE